MGRKKSDKTFTNRKMQKIERKLRKGKGENKK
jgi:hypothetical protein